MRCLWCEKHQDSLLIKSRMINIINTFKAYGDFIGRRFINKLPDSYKDLYGMHIDDVGKINLSISNFLVRNDDDDDGLFSDIIRITIHFIEDSNLFNFIIPREWLESENTSSLNNLDYNQHQFYDEINEFIEDYI